jgi:hypothetical protein
MDFLNLSRVFELPLLRNAQKTRQKIKGGKKAVTICFAVFEFGTPLAEQQPETR